MTAGAEGCTGTAKREVPRLLLRDRERTHGAGVAELEGAIFFELENENPRGALLVQFDGFGVE